MERKDELEAQVRKTALRERLDECRTRIGKMCSEGRPPRMCIPVQWDDDDFYISTTLADAQRALDAERANRLAMEACVDRDVKAIKDLKAQLATLQAQLRQVEEALQERKEFIADCDTALDRIQAPRTNEGQEELVSTWRRIELLGKLLYQYRQELERSAPALRAENARLRKAMQSAYDYITNHRHGKAKAMLFDGLELYRQAALQPKEPKS